VTFDAGKKSAHVLCKDKPVGDNFRVLGVLFDSKPTMVPAVKETVTEAKWRLRVLERSAKYFTVPQLVKKYKARVLSYVEYRTAAVYHATDTVLEPLNNLQERYLRRFGITEIDSLINFRLAPLSCRRDMAMLGVLHRAALKKGPEHFHSFFFQGGGAATVRTRLSTRRHTAQLKEYRQGRFLEILRRSALGLVAVYNRLPQRFVDSLTVADFQRNLQEYLVEQLEN